jgi:small acid-soluble spore protein H (minor)
MDLKRAKEIIASPVMMNVTYNGTPIYIESITGDTTAYVHPLNQPNKRQKVDLTSLIEQ